MGDLGPALRDIGIGPQINLLIFDAPTEPLDEDVVPPGTFPIHADPDLVLHQKAREGGAGELSPSAPCMISVAASKHFSVNRKFRLKQLI